MASYYPDRVQAHVQKGKKWLPPWFMRKGYDTLASLWAISKCCTNKIRVKNKFEVTPRGKYCHRSDRVEPTALAVRNIALALSLCSANIFRSDWTYEELQKLHQCSNHNNVTYGIIEQPWNNSKGNSFTASNLPQLASTRQVLLIKCWLENSAASQKEILWYDNDKNILDYKRRCMFVSLCPSLQWRAASMFKVWMWCDVNAKDHYQPELRSVKD